MPIMNVHYEQGTLTPAQKSALADKLTDFMITMEGGANTTGGRRFAWVIYTEVARGDWWAGGRTDDAFVSPPGRFLVDVRIPEGYMNAAHKTEVHAGVNAALMEVLGASGRPDVGGSAQVVLQEVPEGDWGCGGRTISLASIAGAVGLSKTSQRFAWVLAYFAAKARAYRAAGFPEDVGGLLPEASGQAVDRS